MLILRPSNSGLKRLINIQKCRSSTKLDHCALCTVYVILVATNGTPELKVSESVQKPNQIQFGCAVACHMICRA